MNVILYAASSKEEGSRLAELVKIMVPRKKLEIFHTMEDLTCRLRRPRMDEIVCVVQAIKQQELTELLAIEDLLQGTRLFLVLPDRHPDTIANGYRLRPRFITYRDADYQTGSAVLKKMFDNVIQVERQSRPGEILIRSAGGQ